MNEIKVTKRTTCRLCESPRLELGASLAPTPVAEKYVARDELDLPTPAHPLDLFICLDCGHVQLLYVVDSEYLFDNYTYVSGGTKSLVQHFDECAAATIERFKIGTDSLIVDIGSNDGSLLRCFQRRGLRVLGVDPAKEIARKATEAGIPTFPAFLTQELAGRIRREHGPASVVCAFNVYAHADALGLMTESIRELLSPTGVFVFEFSYLMDIFDRMLLGTIFHEHLSYHSLKPMDLFLKRHGLELIDVQRNLIQGGSVIGTAQFIGGPHLEAPSVKESLRLEEARNIDKPETLKMFAAKLQQVKGELGGLIADFKNQGKSVWGYGAARSGTTLIAQMNLGGIISHIVDDSPDKQDMFSPGDHIPILPAQALTEKMPDYVFILAWIHAPSIIRNNREYLAKGGRFILCFPEIQIVGEEETGDQ
ncbi:MAG: class I SAM-dependent methyltransferase [Verrucomicrobia bacterium]|nr:class I SAM-dependent methyltransferase [Verrucomicrobiota bacterium]